MSLLALKHFFAYKPVMEADPQHIIDEIKDIASKYLDVSHLIIIQETYEYAKQAHLGQMRQSGEYYISHIVQATRFLMMIRPDIETIQWCLLHDVIEDTTISYDDILSIFGLTVAMLCEWVTKVSKLKYRGEERQIETVKKTFFAMSEDLRVIFIKLADRIHNIQTLYFHPDIEKQQRIAHETLEIYIPIAERLGLYQFHYLLENGCFRVLYPLDCSQIVSYLDTPSLTTAVDTGIQKLTASLTDQWFEFVVKGRLKSPYSIWKKMSQKYKISDIKNIYDIIAFRVIVDTVASCYLAMGVIHTTTTPLVHKIKDYIVVPKPNGYQSIHSIVLWLCDMPVEIQIRTIEMNQYADFGVAAHFAYKEQTHKHPWTSRISTQQSKWIQTIQDIVQSYQDDNETFKKEMKIELLDDHIFLYTPKWEVVEMKLWSTVLDFAFRIHSQIWLHFKHALVNNNIVPLDFQPKTGDIITITTRKNKISARPTWMDVLQTSTARGKLNQYLKFIQKDDLIKKSKYNLNQKLLELWLPNLGTWDCQITKIYHKQLPQFEQKLLDLLENGGIISFINQCYHILSGKQTETTTTTTKTTWSVREVIVDGQYFAYHFCPECESMTSQIIAKSDKRGMKIHHIWCRALASIEYEKLIIAQYTDDPKPLYRFYISLQIENTPGILNKILSIATLYHINIVELSFVDTLHTQTTGSITLEFSNPSKIFFVLKDLDRYSPSITILEKRFI